MAMSGSAGTYETAVGLVYDPQLSVTDLSSRPVHRSLDCQLTQAPQHDPNGAEIGKSTQGVGGDNFSPHLDNKRDKVMIRDIRDLSALLSAPVSVQPLGLP